MKIETFYSLDCRSGFEWRMETRVLPIQTNSKRGFTLILMARPVTHHHQGGSSSSNITKILVDLDPVHIDLKSIFNQFEIHFIIPFYLEKERQLHKDKFV